jgi:tetratricopeptide (TPR) repeat protein
MPSAARRLAPWSAVAACVLTVVVHLSAQTQTPPASLAALRAAYERGDYEAVAAGVRQARDLRRLLREASERIDNMRENIAPLEAPRVVPRRELLFGIEFTGAAIVAGSDEARKEAEALLVKYQKWMTQGLVVDEFECLWHLVALVVLESQGSPEARPIVDTGRARCPASARLVFADARLLDREWTFRGGGAAMPPGHVRLGPGTELIPLAAAGPQPTKAIASYEAAIEKPETHVEARIRLAWLLFRTAAHDRALTLLEGLEAGSQPDHVLTYLLHLFRGQVLHALSRPTEAAESLTRALEISPGAQSARTSLMAVHLARGDRAAAVALAAEIETAPANQGDPWWLYPGGDIRLYSQMIGRLREVAR